MTSFFLFFFSNIKGLKMYHSNVLFTYQSVSNTNFTHRVNVNFSNVSKVVWRVDCSKEGDVTLWAAPTPIAVGGGCRPRRSSVDRWLQWCPPSRDAGRRQQTHWGAFAPSWKADSSGRSWGSARLAKENTYVTAGFHYRFQKPQIYFTASRWVEDPHRLSHVSVFSMRQNKRGNRLHDT